MTIRKILYYPDSKLRTVSKPIEKIDANIEKLIKDMFETMYAHTGIGLAAPQIGVPLKLAIIDYDNHKPLVLINPKITDISEEKTKDTEGCLSLPGVRAIIERPKFVKVKAMDRKGNPMEIKTDDSYFARAWQHEIDHLYGKLYIDYLSTLKRERLVKKMQKFLKDKM